MRNILKNLIIENPTVVKKGENLNEALKKMKEYNNIPVIDENNKYFGVISKVPSYEAIFENENAKNSTVDNFLMEYTPVTLDDTLDEIIAKLKETRCLFLPVVNEDNELLGIIPNKKMLNLFSNSIGSENKGENLVVVYRDMKGVLSKLTTKLYKENVSIISMTIVNLKVMNLKKVFCKVDAESEKVEEIKEKLKKNGFNVQ
ncbi:CBS domain-containing protein [Oceanirhabdus seepicola]|uniref:CBS domain-containing protein n=1 Tax=Oceanirhabdus seepicola TaxID=2828781 RepID=A0A9J6P471_9CLOT|nr:CBS domain-containing protein [Oceanirhabdus seepicola]MCM1990950.1 CBS domain-containing protein [Oceanirhabdus seepicola]